MGTKSNRIECWEQIEVEGTRVLVDSILAEENRIVLVRDRDEDFLKNGCGNSSKRMGRSKVKRKILKLGGWGVRVK